MYGTKETTNFTISPCNLCQPSGTFETSNLASWAHSFMMKLFSTIGLQRSWPDMIHSDSMSFAFPLWKNYELTYFVSIVAACMCTVCQTASLAPPTAANLTNNIFNFLQYPPVLPIDMSSALTHALLFTWLALEQQHVYFVNSLSAHLVTTNFPNFVFCFCLYGCTLFG